MCWQVLVALLLFAAFPRQAFAAIQMSASSFLGVTSPFLGSSQSGASHYYAVYSNLAGPGALYAGPGGTLFIATNHATGDNVLMVSPDGTVTPVAGTAFQVGGIATDGNGNLLVTDYGNSKLWTYPWALGQGGWGFGTPVLSTQAFTGHPAGVLVDPDGDILVCVDTEDGSGTILSSTIQEITGSSGPLFPQDSTGAVQITDTSVTPSNVGTIMQYPAFALAMDASENLYVAPFLLPLGSTSVAGFDGLGELSPGTGDGQYLSVSGFQPGSPDAMAIDGNGRIFYSQQELSTSAVGLVGMASNGSGVQIEGPGTPGNPTAVTATGSNPPPLGLATSPLGGLFIADTQNNQILRYMYQAVDFGAWPTSADSSSATTLTLPFQVRDANSTATVVSLETDALGSNGSEFSGTFKVDTTQSTALLTVTAQFAPRFGGLRLGAVNVYDSSGNLTVTLPIFGTGQEARPVFTPSAPAKPVLSSSAALPVTSPGQMALGPQTLYVANAGMGNVVALPLTGSGTASVVDTSAVGLGGVGGVAVDGSGNLYISDPVLDEIVVIPPASGGLQPWTMSVSGLGLPGALAVDPAGDLFIADARNNGGGGGSAQAVKAAQPALAAQAASRGSGQVLMVSWSQIETALLENTATSGSGQAAMTGQPVATPGVSLSAPITGIAVDGQENLYIADPAAGQVVMVPGLLGGPAQALTLPAGTFPDVAVDPTGNLYLADPAGNQLWMMPGGPAGVTGGAVAIPLTGLPSPGLSGPDALAANATGGLFIADSGNNRVLLLARGTPGTLQFPYTQAGTTSSSQSVLLTNIGNQPLTFSAVTFPASFAAGTSDAATIGTGTALGQGASGDVPVVFEPTTGNPTTGNLTLTDNARNAAANVETITLSGSDSTPDPTTMTGFTVTPATVGNGQAATFSVTVKDTANGSRVPTGSVGFSDTTTGLSLGPAVALDSTGTATQSATLSGLGSHTISAAFTSLDGSFGPIAATLDVSVLNVTGTSLSSSPNPSQSGQSITLSAQVNASNGRLGTPGGTVNFYDNPLSGPSFLGSSTLDGSGYATLATSALAVGAHRLTAVYAGDATTFATSSSPALVQLVTAAGSSAATVTLVSSSNPSVVGATVSFTATVAGTTTPTGTVAFQDGGTTLATVGLAGGTASFSTAALAKGYHNMSALYLGDATFASASSPTVSQAVGVLPLATVNLTSSPNPATFGSLVTFTFTASGNSSNVPTGTVIFVDTTTSTQLFSTGLSSGTATFQTANLPVGSTTIEAVYNGDTNYAGGSIAVNQVVNLTTPVLTFPAPPSVPYGSPVTLNAFVTFPAGDQNGALPTGTVLFYEGSVAAANLVGGGTVDAITATEASTTLPLPSTGSHTYIAVYGGDANYASVTSAPVSLTVAKDTPAVKVSGPSLFTLGQTANFSVTVSGGGATAVATGTVQLMDGSVNLGPALTLVNGVASFSTTSLLGGQHSISATYAGDSNYLTATGTLTPVVTVNPTLPSMTLTSSLNPSAVGQSVTFTATVTGLSLAVPSGTVKFTDETNGAPLGTATLNGSGAATFSLANLPEGVNNIVAAYSGDTNYSVQSALVGQNVGQASTATILTSSQNPAPLGQKVVFTATVTSNTGNLPSGTVNFSIDGTPTAATLGAQNGSMIAQVSTSTLTQGTHTVTATYLGDSNDTTSSSPSLTQTITIGAATVTLTPSLNPSTYGQTVSFSAAVSSSTGNVPQGSVAFKDGSTTLATLTLTGGSAAYSTSALAEGSHSLTAVYSGDSNNGTATGSLTETVNAATTTVKLTSSAASSSYGQSVTLTATVTSNGGNTPTGSVTFKDGATPLGTVTMTNGSAAVSTSTLTGGSHGITATYSGDSNDGGSSASLSQAVNPATTAVGLSSSLNPSTFGQSVTLTAAVTSVAGNIPTGTVSFLDGSTSLGTATLNGSGVATVTTSTLPAGSDSITATYSGDTNDANSATSQALVQVVASQATATVTLVSRPNPSVLGQKVTFTAKVSLTSGTPTGSVRFLDGTTVLATVALSGGSASFSTASLGVGSHAVTASYAGQTSAAVQQVVDGNAASTVNVSSSQDPSLASRAVAFTVTVHGRAGTPTGSVNLTIDGTSVATLKLSGGSASYTAPSLKAGLHVVIAFYNGDPSYAPEPSLPFLQLVLLAPSVSLNSSPDPSKAGTAVTLTATVTGSGPVPTGVVSFEDASGRTCLGQAKLAGNGTAKFSTTSLAAGSHTLVARYRGDGTYARASSPGLTQNVQ